MAESPFDPIATWQKMVSDWEKQVNDASAKVAGTEQFSSVMNQATQFSVMAQQQFAKQMEEVLKACHLPSKADIGAIQDRLAAIEESIERLTVALRPEEQPAGVHVARTRRPPSDSP